MLEAAPHYNAQYSPINIGFQVLGWLYGEDFGDTLCKTVNCGYDTDCTGATIGSVLGILATRQGLPQRWTEPLGEGISTNESWGGIRAVSTGPNPVPTTLDELTERVIVMAERVLSAHGLLGNGASVEVDPADLYADDEVRELWNAHTMHLVYQAQTCDVTVDYGDTPAIAAGGTRVHYHTAGKSPCGGTRRALHTGSRQQAGGRAAAASTVDIAPHTAVGADVDHHSAGTRSPAEYQHALSAGTGGPAIGAARRPNRADRRTPLPVCRPLCARERHRPRTLRPQLCPGNREWCNSGRARRRLAGGLCARQ